MTKPEKHNAGRKDKNSHGSPSSRKNGEDRGGQVTTHPLTGPGDVDNPSDRDYFWRGRPKGKPRGGGLPYPPRPGIEAPEKWDGRTEV